MLPDGCHDVCRVKRGLLELLRSSSYRSGIESAGGQTRRGRKKSAQFRDFDKEHEMLFSSVVRTVALTRDAGHVAPRSSRST